MEEIRIRTPADRIAGAEKVWRTPSFSAILLILVLLGGQQFTYGLDSHPSSNEAEDELDETIYNIIPDALRWELAGFSVLDSSAYSGNCIWVHLVGFNDQGWNGAYEWLANQDMQDDYSEKPALFHGGTMVSKHWILESTFSLRQLPVWYTSIRNMLLARSQEDLISMFIWQLAQGDLSYSSSNGNGYELTNGFENIVDNHLSDAQFELFKTSQNKISKDGRND